MPAASGIPQTFPFCPGKPGWDAAMLHMYPPTTWPKGRPFWICWEEKGEGETDLQSHFNRHFRLPHSHRRVREIPCPWFPSPTLVAVHYRCGFFTLNHTTVLGLGSHCSALRVSSPKLIQPCYYMVYCSASRLSWD